MDIPYPMLLHHMDFHNRFKFREYFFHLSYLQVDESLTSKEILQIHKSRSRERLYALTKPLESSNQVLYSLTKVSKNLCSNGTQILCTMCTSIWSPIFPSMAFKKFTSCFYSNVNILRGSCWYIPCNQYSTQAIVSK